MLSATLARDVRFLRSGESAARSALAAIPENSEFPWLITTGDHPLLTVEMLHYFLAEAARSHADLCVGLATAETIVARFPEARRTYLAFGPRSCLRLQLVCFDVAPRTQGSRLLARSGKSAQAALAAGRRLRTGGAAALPDGKIDALRRLCLGLSPPWSHRSADTHAFRRSGRRRRQAGRQGACGKSTE